MKTIFLNFVYDYILAYNTSLIKSLKIYYCFKMKIELNKNKLVLKFSLFDSNFNSWHFQF